MRKEYLKRKRNEVTINITDGKLDSFREKDETQTTVRVYENGKIGVAGCLGDGNFNDLEKIASERLENNVSYASFPSAPLKKQILREQLATDVSKIIPETKRLAKKVAEACPGFIVNGKTQFALAQNNYKNSDGSELDHKNSEFTVFFQFKDRDSSNIADAYYGSTTGRYGKSIEDKIVNDTKMLHDSFFMDKVVLPDGKYPVIFDLYSIFGLLSKDFIAEYYISNGSLISGRLGEKVFNDKLSVYVDRNQKTNRLSAFFDGEGEVAVNYRAPIIKNGVVTNVLTCKNSALTFNLPNSKTAGAVYDGVPSVGIPALYASTKDENLSEMLKGEKAIYVAITSGGDITTEGIVGLPVMLAFLVENGKITGRVSDFNASGSIFDILGNDFIGVTGDIFEASESQVIVSKMNVLSDKK